MYYFLSLIAGLLISVMVLANGALTDVYGAYSATVIIHFVGLIAITIAAFIKKDKTIFLRQKWFLYIGGFLGVMTVVFNNMAFGRISISAILALGLFGQSVTGLLIDQFGLWGMERFPFVKKKIIGLMIILIGIASMIDNFQLLAVVLSFSTGITIVISRTFNAKLALKTSVLASSFFNYAFGIIGAVIVLLILGVGERPYFGDFFSQNPERWWIYMGGLLGLSVVLLSNVIVVKISAFYFTLFLFVGQMSMGIIIDMVLMGYVAKLNIIGSILVAIGLVVNLSVDRYERRNVAN